MAVHPLLMAIATTWILNQLSGTSGDQTLPRRRPWPGGGWEEELAPEQDPATTSRAKDMLELLDPGTFKDEPVYTADLGVLNRRFYLMPDRSEVLVYRPAEPITRSP